MYTPYIYVYVCMHIYVDMYAFVYKHVHRTVYFVCMVVFSLAYILRICILIIFKYVPFHYCIYIYTGLWALYIYTCRHSKCVC